MGAVALLAATVVLGWPATRATAHSSLVESSPSPGATVGGTIEVVQLRFGSEVTDPVVTLGVPDGERIPVVASMESATTVVAEFPELSEPGQHIVEYEVVSGDGIRVESAYAFTFDPAAPPPPALAPTAASATDEASNRWVALVPGVLSVMLLMFVAERLIRRRQLNKIRSAGP